MQSSVNTDNLADIRNVNVDKNLPKEERISEFVRQIKDPHHFRCGKFIVRTSFESDGPSLEDCMQRIIA